MIFIRLAMFARVRSLLIFSHLSRWLSRNSTKFKWNSTNNEVQLLRCTDPALRVSNAVHERCMAFDLCIVGRRVIFIRILERRV